MDRSHGLEAPTSTAEKARLAGLLLTRRSTQWHWPVCSAGILLGIAIATLLGLGLGLVSGLELGLGLGLGYG